MNALLQMTRPPQTVGFAQRAQELLETAVAGPPGSDLTLLIGHNGAFEMCHGSETSASEWPLEALARARGARAAYRVTSRGGTVRVEGREGLRTCLLEAQRPHWLLS